LLAILSFSFLLPPDGIFSRLGFENGGRIKPRIEIHLFAMNQKDSIKPSQKKVQVRFEVAPPRRKIEDGTKTAQDRSCERNENCQTFNLESMIGRI